MTAIGKSAPGSMSTSIKMPMHVTWFFANADGAAASCSATLSITKESGFTKQLLKHFLE
jgi:hypothetical protein